MATKRNLIRLTAGAEETAARAVAAKEAVRVAKSALKEARKTLKSAKKDAKQARRKFEAASAGSGRDTVARKTSIKKSKKAPARKPRASSPDGAVRAARSHAVRKTVATKRADMAPNEDQASSAALSSTLV